MRTSAHHPSGFTLLELVLVMVIVCIVLAMASPSLRGWSRGSMLRNVSDDFLALTRLARSQAVASAQVHRLCVDSEGTYYLAVQQGLTFELVESSIGRPVQLPPDFRIDVVKQNRTAESCISFYPDGRTEPARVRIVSYQAGFVDIECPSPAETFQVTGTGDTP